MKASVWRVTVALLVLVAVGSAWEYYNTVYRWRGSTRLVDSFLAFGARADTAALRRAASDSAPVSEVLATPAPTLDRLRQSLRLRWAQRNRDAVVLDYATGLNFCYQVHLIRKQTGWLIARAVSEPC